MSRTLYRGAIDTRSGSNERGASLVSDVIQLAGCNPLHPVARLHGPERKIDRAQFYPMMGLSVGQREGRLSERSPADPHRAAQAGYSSPVQGDRLSRSFLASMQTGNNLSPDLFASVFAGPHGEESVQHLFTSRAALKLAKFFNAMIEIAKSFTFFLICLFGGLVITGVVLSPLIYLSFFSLH